MISVDSRQTEASQLSASENNKNKNKNRKTGRQLVNVSVRRASIIVMVGRALLANI